ncbi:hypothetical protein CYFUS_007426 [Cystobacter fuscus]|uniref:SnoaL-like domain-containing protein n=1 Tax=Cystobacter fuscus TaxID=43 RepID=A0A250JED0_9BACT|nr:nuclear transport factor 2 family protein [Cystobacter fuscus]ATB41950.1 hypothetical protein CYFUS_007426 [Cystobacter fuscus]
MRTIPFVSVLVLVMGFQGSSKASDSCCDTSSPAVTAEMGGVEERAILRAVEGYAEGFIREDMRLLLNLWDHRAPEGVSYVAAELDQPLSGAEELRAYYQSFLNTLIVYSGEVTNLRIFLKGDMAYVFCQFNWVYRVRAGGQVLEQPTRATFVLRKRGGRWLYHHFHESISFHYEAPAAPSLMGTVIQ